MKLIAYSIGGGLLLIMSLWIYSLLKISQISDERMSIMINTCPDCGMRLIHESGCVRCPHCGYNPCK